MKDTMTVIELLNKIANKEEVPKRIKYGSYEYEWFFGAIENKWGYARLLTDGYFGSFEKDLNLGDWEVLNSTVTILEYDKPLKELQYLNCTDVDIHDRFTVTDITKDHIILDIQTLQKWVNKIIKEINKEDK